MSTTSKSSFINKRKALIQSRKITLFQVTFILQIYQSRIAFLRRILCKCIRGEAFSLHPYSHESVMFRAVPIEYNTD